MSQSKTIRLYSLALILFVVNSVLLFYLVSSDFRKSQPEVQKQKLTSILNDRISYFSAFIKENSNYDFSHVLNHVEESLRVNSFSGYRVYVNDSLTFWSDNFVNFPSVLSADVEPIRMERHGAYWILVARMQWPDRQIYLFDRVYDDYPVDNSYLLSRFCGYYRYITTLKPVEGQGTGLLLLRNGLTLNVVSISDQFAISLNQWIFLLLIISDFVFLAVFLFTYFARHGLFHGTLQPSVKLLISYVFTWLSFYFLTRYLGHFHKGQLFSPALFASGIVHSNLALLCVNAVGLWLLSFMVFEFLKRIPYRVSKWIMFFALFLIGLFFGLLALFSHQVLLNTAVIPDAIAFNDKGFYLLILYGVIFIAFISWLLMALRIIDVYKSRNEATDYYSALLFAAGLLLPSVFSSFSVPLILILFFSGLFIWLIINRFFHESVALFKVSLPWLLLILAIFTILISAFVYHVSKQKELIIRQAVVQKYLKNDRDFLAESYLKELSTALKADTVMLRLANDFYKGITSQSELSAHIYHQYLQGYLKRFAVQITYCFPMDKLNLSGTSESVSCQSFFDAMIQSGDRVNQDTSLTFCQRAFTNESFYLLAFEFRALPQPLRVYLEVVPNGVSRGIGIPEIALQSSGKAQSLLSRYSYAYYSNQRLQYRAGDFPYWYDFPENHLLKSSQTLFSSMKWSHLVLNEGDGSFFIISQPEYTFWYGVTLFSYLFIGFGLLLLVFAFLYRVLIPGHSPFDGFSHKFQAAIFFLVFFSMLLIGIVSVIYIFKLNEIKNRSVLTDKSHSILIELQHKLSGYSGIGEIPQPYLESQLMKFAEVFFTDINLFDASGRLIASSNPDAFQNGVMAPYMNPDALAQFQVQNISTVVHREWLGNEPYSSSYLPFMNANGEVLAYLNLPSFRKVDDLRREIGNFLVAFMNTYAILLVAALLFGLLVSRILTRPLQLLAGSLASTKLGLSNKRIEWEGDDEIGQLIKQYNSMIDELDSDAIELKVREREATWHEMARQVAHEIKNPLTPLKLNLQLLVRAWKDGADDFGYRLEKFSVVMEEQIDKLMSLASGFGKVSSLPAPRYTQIEVQRFLESLSTLHRDCELRISFDTDIPSDFVLESDQEWLDIIFNNLVLNGIQSVIIGTPRIFIAVSFPPEAGGFVDFSITDNGAGIPEKEQSKIFTPYFTTKSHGSGIGLHLVAQLVNQLMGKIWFESKPGEGTTFFLRFPIRHRINQPVN